MTTNYDEWLDRAIDTPGPTVVPAAEATSSTIHTPRNVCYRVDDLTADNLLNRPNTVIHLHGSLRGPDEMVLTTPQYLLHYANDRLSGDSTRENKVLTFLEILFRQRTVLFVGYGLEELEILEYIIVKARPPQQEEGRREIRHYLLQGFFSHEQELMLHLMSYYGEFGIQLIPFLRDEKDWDQLIDVLDDFARHAPASDPMKLQTLLDMEGLLDA